MAPACKIKDLTELVGVLAEHRAAGRRIVHCHGVFDLLHIGHIRYFEQARQRGDLLVVTLTPDQHVDKGPGRPAFGEALRAESIASLSCVDFVAINRWPTAEETLRLLRPHVYVKGSEFKDVASDPTGKMALEEQVVLEIGAELAFTEDVVFSSSNLINRFLSKFPEEVDAYLKLFRHRYPLPDLSQLLGAIGGKRVLVVGDTILDEYQYCDVIGKSSKDPVLAMKYASHDLFAGGVLAIANHVASFAGSVELLTVLGERDRQEEFIRAKLAPNIDAHFVTHPGAPTLVKRRFIEGYTMNKLFEVYVMDDSGLPPAEDRLVCDWLRPRLGEYDVVIAADFGHGAISSALVEVLDAGARFLAVNAQANAGNRGFHTLAKYPHADYASLAEHEIRMQQRDLRGNLRSLMDDVAHDIECPLLAVTRGREGCLIRGGRREFVEVPSFATRIVDRVGAGDAFFSVTALAAAVGAPPELIGFLGNVAGALAVEILGNQKPIDRPSIQKYVTALLK